jgi:caspase 2
MQFQEMLSVARQFVHRPEHRHADSCVVIVLTHGGNDYINGVDGSKINTHDFWACFNSASAPLLAGKPKFFIMQSCRGGKTIFVNDLSVPVVELHEF